MSKDVKDKRDYRQELTDRIIEQLENGTAPWIKPWESIEKPFNLTTNKSYQGINNIALSSSGYADPRWCTYKQAEENGWQVKKGEKATPIEYWQFTKQVEQKDENGKPLIGDDGQPKTTTIKLNNPIFKNYFVFNAQQMDGVPAYEQKTPTYDWKPIDKAEEILKNSGANIQHKLQDKAYYSPSRDIISLPQKEQFKSDSAYYETALHELGHWTGHSSRLNREMVGGFGTPEYAKEELRAELASYFLSNEIGIPHDPSNHASYIENWIEVLKNDKNEIYRASADACKISDYVMSFSLEKNQALETNAQIESRAESSTLPSNPALTDIKINVSKEDLESRAIVKDLGAKYSGENRTWYVEKGDNLNKYTQWLDGKALTLKDTAINVPIAEKDVVKSIGGQWDKDNTKWVIPAGIDISKLPTKYFEEQKEKISTPTNKMSVEEFATNFGLKIDSTLIADGKIHRVSLIDRPHKKDGAYKLYDDANGKVIWVKDHVSGNTASYAEKSENYKPLSAEQKKEKQIIEQEDREKLNKEAARKAEYLINHKFQKAQSHPYLEKKGIQPHNSYINSEKNLIIPLQNIDGDIKGFQWINKDGEKGIMKNTELSGSFHLFGVIKDKVVICEGFATGASIHEAANVPVISAMVAGNLEKVSKTVHEKYGNDVKIYLAADNDHTLVNNPKVNCNRGVVDAEKAASACNGEVIVPQLNKQEIERGLTDFNDIAQSRGKFEVMNQINKAMVEKEKVTPMKMKEMEMS